MSGLLDGIETNRAALLAAKEGAERARKDARKVCRVGRRKGFRKNVQTTSMLLS